jgi:hypothetical protein
MSFRCQTSGVEKVALASNVDILDGKKHSILFAYDATNGTAVLFVDGEDADNTGWVSRVAPTTTTITASSCSYSAGKAWWASSNYFTGAIGALGFGGVYITDPTIFFDDNNDIKKLDEDNWTEWGSQPLYWNEHGCMSNNKGSAGNMTQSGTITVSDEEVVVTGFHPNPPIPNTFLSKLVSWWEMDEYSAGTGLVTRVDSHRDIDLTDNGGLYVPSVEDPDIGRAAHFINTTSDGAGASNLYNSADEGYLRGYLGFSVWGWFVPYYLDNWSYLLAVTDNGTSSIAGESWAMGIAGDETFFSRVIVSDTDSISYSTEIAQTNTPYFVCMTFNQIDGWHGISVNGGAFESVAISGRSDADGDTFNVGRRGFTSNRMYFMGAMNRVGLSIQPLSMAEVLWLYNSGTGRSYSELA